MTFSLVIIGSWFNSSCWFKQLICSTFLYSLITLSSWKSVLVLGRLLLTLMNVNFYNTLVNAVCRFCRGFEFDSLDISELFQLFYYFFLILDSKSVSALTSFDHFLLLLASLWDWVRLCIWDFKISTLTYFSLQVVSWSPEFRILIFQLSRSFVCSIQDILLKI
jgi:hypothetical protein